MLLAFIPVLLYAAVCFALSKRELAAAAGIERALSGELETIEKENLAVRNKLTEGWSEEELEALARRRLGLVRPGDRIFCFTSDARERGS